jgi:hypothetical protein
MLSDEAKIRIWSENRVNNGLSPVTRRDYIKSKVYGDLYLKEPKASEEPKFTRETWFRTKDGKLFSDIKACIKYVRKKKYANT